MSRISGGVGISGGVSRISGGVGISGRVGLVGGSRFSRGVGLAGPGV